MPCKRKKFKSKEAKRKREKQLKKESKQIYEEERQKTYRKTTLAHARQRGRKAGQEAAKRAQMSIPEKIAHMGKAVEFGMESFEEALSHDPFAPAKSKKTKKKRKKKEDDWLWGY